MFSGTDIFMLSKQESGGIRGGNISISDFMRVRLL